jgi:hypothetical protein
MLADYPVALLISTGPFDVPVDTPVEAREQP